MKKIIVLSLISTALFSCKSLQKTGTAKTMDIYGAGVMHMPVIVDLDVREVKVSGTKVGNAGNSLDLLKMEAIATALRMASADVLVEPSYQIETEGSRVTVIATGFPANYKNFRKMTAVDTVLVRPFILQKANSFDPVPEKKKRRGAGVLAGLGAAAAVGGLVMAAGSY